MVRRVSLTSMLSIGSVIRRRKGPARPVGGQRIGACGQPQRSPLAVDGGSTDQRVQGAGLSPARRAALSMSMLSAMAALSGCAIAAERWKAVSHDQSGTCRRRR
jgi:hypothetical protein